MARNLRKYGYRPNRTSDTPAILEAISGSRRVVRRTPAEQRTAIEPMKHGERIRAYMRQNTSGYGRGVSIKATLTPRQLRRLRHKSRLGAVAWERGERP